MNYAVRSPDSPSQYSFFESTEISAKRGARSGTFTDNMKLPVHRWFRYSAGFSAEWAGEQIRNLQPNLVLDPFAGSGTTLLAAAAAQVASIGYESHPFVARIAAAKLGWNVQPRELESAAVELVEVAGKVRGAIADSVPKLLGQCYSPEALKKLFALRDAYISKAPSYPAQVQQLLWLAITAILRSCSFVGTAQWQYVLPNKRKAKSLDPIHAFLQKIDDMRCDIAYAAHMKWNPLASVAVHDARQLSPNVRDGSVDLVLTSPPYPNNYDYADATRLEMTFWGEISGWGDLQGAVRQYIIRSCSQHAAAERLQLDELLRQPALKAILTPLARVCEELAEVREGKGGRKTYHTMIAAYFLDLSLVFHSLRKSCGTGATICFVVGDSAPYGVHVPVEEWLSELAQAAGLFPSSFEKLRDRNTKWKNRKHRVPLKEGRLWIRG